MTSICSRLIKWRSENNGNERNILALFQQHAKDKDDKTPTQSVLKMSV